MSTFIILLKYLILEFELFFSKISLQQTKMYEIA